ncbi:hypothetical protein K2173_002086 [Erythroxylum novogranatense]|uniref:Ethylene-insensitive protein 2 n=1 Tax=Erythroxylum novogranatense TaxID=1862640 RepID=A0AAV8SPI0_9ROSI|nr:hypothetical protein K2173_002086 [Erythroxylum novogranatense]
MEAEFVSTNNPPGVLHGMLPAIAPALLIALGYVDPGKWAATVEGGARFGFDLVFPMVFFNVAAMLCQYLSARIGVVTGRDLAQICSTEYNKFTCMCLGVQTSLSVVMLDLTMILGIAHGLNLLLGMDLSTCVFFTALDAVFSPLFFTFLERYKANFLLTRFVVPILALYIFGVFSSKQETPLSTNGVLTKLNEESLFALMSLLGANIMPHNFYLHSSMVLQHQGPHDVSENALCHKHFWAIFCTFFGIAVVNYVLLNSAANVFYSSDLVLLTFPDALSLLEQVFRSPVAHFAFVLILYLTNQITALTWNLGGQVILHDFLSLDIPNWLQRATVRIIALVPALYCVWTSGVEGVYQLLMFSQVIIALLLPSSVIPLFRVASSRQVMGVYKISQLLEFIAVITFMGLLGLQIIFVIEIIFGDSDWVGNLRWNMGITSSVPYITLLLTASSSFCLMLWLAVTPLKSATLLDAQVWSWDVQDPTHELSQGREEIISGETRFDGEEHTYKQEQVSISDKSIDSYPDIFITKAGPNLPVTAVESRNNLHLTTIEENHSHGTFPSDQLCNQQDHAPSEESLSMAVAVNDVSDGDSVDYKTFKIESIDRVEKTVVVEGDLQVEKKDDEADAWEPEELPKGVPGSTSPLTSDGPASLRSLSGKSDEGGNGAGSLSRLAGLGRAARRQFAATLVEFWGQLYDSHGQSTSDAKLRKWDVLLANSKLASSLLKVDTTGKDFGGYFPSVGGRGSDPMVNSSLSDSPKQPRIQNLIDSLYAFQRGSSPMWSNHMQLPDAYVQGSSCNVVDSSEKRYSSMHTLPSTDGWDTQPSTVHGSSHNVLESTEKKYSSLRNLPSTYGWDAQPATIYGSNRNFLESTGKRYSSMRTLPPNDGWDTQPTTVPGSSHNVLEPSEKKYCSMQTLPSTDGWDALPTTIPGSSCSVLESTEKRYSSMRNLPSTDGWDALPTTIPGSSRSVLESTEKRYSSMRNLPSTDGWDTLPTTIPGSNCRVLESTEKRYSSMRNLPSTDGWDTQPATVHGYQIAPIVNRIAKDSSSNCLNDQWESAAPLSPSLGPRNFSGPYAAAWAQKLQNGSSSPQASRFTASRNILPQPDRAYYGACSSGLSDDGGMSNSKKYHSLPDIPGLPGTYSSLLPGKSAQWDSPVSFGSSIGRTNNEQSFCANTGSGTGGSLAFDELSRGYGDGSLWSKQPFQQFGVADRTRSLGSNAGRLSNSVAREGTYLMDSEAQLLQLFRDCMMKLLKLEGSDWLFRQNDGADEDLIDRVAAREKYLYEAEMRDMNLSGSLRYDETGTGIISVSSVPNCGEDCVWRMDLVVSFGVWCIHRILDLSLMESRPELWGKYTFVLNHLQGIIDVAFSKPRSPLSPCLCLQFPPTYQSRSSPPLSNGMLPPTAKPGRGKCTSSSMLLDLIKDVEMAISSRKGRSGTAAGDVAFPKGKENLVSVLRRYKRRLSNKW